MGAAEAAVRSTTTTTDSNSAPLTVAAPAEEAEEAALRGACAIWSRRERNVIQGGAGKYRVCGIDTI